MSALTKLNRTEFIPFIQIASSQSSTTWARIGFSEIFELAFGEEEVEKNYICYRDKTITVESNSIELPQELTMYEGDPAYDFMIAHFLKLPVGENCLVPALLCFGGTAKKAWKFDALVTAKVINPVDGKITFSLKQGGEVVKGTYTITSGQPTFTPDSSVEKKGKK